METPTREAEDTPHDDPFVMVVVTCRLPPGRTTASVAAAAEQGAYQVAGNARAYYAPCGREEAEEP